MKSKSINNFMKVIPASFVLSTSLLAMPTSSFAEESSTKRLDPRGQVVPTSTLQKGLLSHYFKDKDFQTLSHMATQTTGDLSEVSPEIKPLLEGENKFQSAYWEGRIKIDESQMYQFTTSADKFVKLWIDGVQVIDQGKGDSMYKYKQRVYLKKGKVYNIRIEYQNPHQVSKDLGVKLYWTKGNDLSGAKKELIPEDHLFLPKLEPKNRNENLVKHSRVARSIGEPEEQQGEEKKKLPDSDNDGIPDTLETNGYTVVVKGGKMHVFPWIESMYGNKKELTKYLSSPEKWSTTMDPYSDFQKVTGMIDKQVKYEARNPLVAAYPIVNVDMEQIVLSKNQTVSLNDGGSKSNTVSRSTSTSTTDATTESINTEVSASLSDFGVKVSGSLSKEHSTTVGIDNSKSDTSESNWSKTIGIQTGEAAHFAAGIRYYNQGTAPIYTVKPTITFSLMNNHTIASIAAKENQIANFIGVEESYPAQSQAPILLNAKDDFGSSPITLNFDQLNQLEKELQLKIDTDQVSGEIGRYQTNGEITTSGDWSTYLPQIKSTSARIMINDYMDKNPIERRVAAIDPHDPIEQTKPEITLKEALKLAFPDISEKDGTLYYKGQSLKDNFELVLDTETGKNIANQLSQMDDKNIYNVKLNAKMNIMINAKMTNLDPHIFLDFGPDREHYKFEFTPNPKAPSGSTYLLKDVLNPKETKIVEPGTNPPFQFTFPNGKYFELVVKLPNGREHVVYQSFYDSDIKNDISNLFAQYQRGSGLSNGVTQATIDETRIKVENTKDENLKKELQKKVNEAQMLLNLKPNYTTYYKKEIHNAYTFEFQTNSKAPSDVMYKLSDLAKPERESWEIIGKKGPNEAWWLDYLPSGKQYDLVAQLPDGTEYVIHEQK
ncbi:PA14 domain-containing protein [Bacillus mycoides]|uniref:binary toxin-like calcium binding domain-containing protein n=1 Tax=Bacillus mycoides TaxID=1405 RepID=UPI002E1D1135|nr:PA14 domain-containing protein [Bacillus mycoides]